MEAGGEAESRGLPAARASRDLLSVGRGGTDLHDKLLINSKLCKKKGAIVAIPRSSLLDRVQGFLPEIAQANETLRREMTTAPPQLFDIENLDDAPSTVIEMNVALVELSDSDTSDAEEESSSGDAESESEEDPPAGEVTMGNIKLPQPNGKKKGKIEILENTKE